MNRTPNTRRGFTLVELLVVVLILAILMAVALPLYLNAIKNSEKGTARANMQTIANAEQSAKLANTTHTYVPIATDADYANLPDLTNPVHGPGDRTYIVTPSPATTPGTPCNDANGMAQTPPAGSFSVHSASLGGNGGDAIDGCFIPGVTSN